MSATTKQGTDVYLAGDPAPLETTLSVAEILDKMVALHEAREIDPAAIVFLVLPMDDRPDAYVRLHAIAALVPTPEGEDQ